MVQAAISADPLAKFREHVSKKLREDIGSMLPDEALDALVQEAVRQQFFEPRKVERGYHTETIPSWFVEEVTKTAEPILERCVERYVKENEEVLKKAFDEFVSSQNLALISFAALRASMVEDLNMLVQNIVERLRQGY